MNRREEVIALVLTRTPETVPGGHKQLRQALEAKSTHELEQIYSQILLEAKEEEYLRIQAERAANYAMHQLHTQRDPRRIAEVARQEKQDEQTFEQAARTLKLFSLNQANFALTRHTLGPNFTIYQIQQAVSSNALDLSPATQEEQDEWTRQEIKAYNQRLLNSDLPTLRRLAREAGSRGPAPVAADEMQRVRAAERADGFKYPPLPDEFRDGNGEVQVLNAEFVKRCSKETLRLLIRRFGSAQVNELLRKRVAGSIWEF